MGFFAQFELSMIKERQREGIAIAKAKGVQIGRKAKLNKDSVPKIKTLWETGLNKMQIAKELEVSRVTLYDFINKNGVKLIRQNVAA